ncbi:MAG: methylated-DNA--[protein]-cysteine S-methyltransferase [Thermoleophilaceae bacterium]|nr:methylated-DNA--[protein]-cysteine S-methyltransferase [Thermoleophilaceae bacterium]
MPERDLKQVEAVLSGRPAPDPAAWRRVRAELASRAGAEGLVDVAFERHDSPLGSILIGATHEGLVRIGLPTEDEDEVLAELARRISVRVLGAPRGSVTEARRQLDEYFDGRRTSFALPLDWQLTRGFRRDVLRATAQIPYGRTASYREVATQAGRPAAVRAAGTALATNPLPIVVPCHRVLRTGGAIGSYRGGAEAKARLLDLEHSA